MYPRVIRGLLQPSSGNLKLHAGIKQAALQRGLMVYPMGGTVDGRRGDHVLIAPPFIITEAEFDAVITAAEAAT